MYKKIAGILLTAAMALLCGCGKRADGEEIAKELNQYDEEATNGDAGENAEINEETAIPNHVTETVVGELGYEYIIDADVVSDGYQNAAVYEVSMPDPSDALIKQYADRLFDNSEYTVVKPYENMSMEELQAEQAFLEALIERDKNGEILLSGETYLNAGYVEDAIAGYTGDNVMEIPKGKLLLEETTAGEDDNGGNVTVTTYTSRLRGKVDGEWWELTFYTRDGRGYRSLQLKNLEFTQEVYSYAQMDEMSNVIYGANNSDRNECEMAADAFIEKLGYTDMSLAHTGNAVNTDTETSKTYLNGYRFVYTRNLEMQVGFSNQNMASTVSPYESSGDYDLESEMKNERVALQEYIWCAASEGRVYAVQIDNIYDVGKRMSENTALLGFEQALDVARETIKKEIDDYEATVASESGMTEIELRYLVAPYGEGQYAMVPVWIFYHDLGFGYYDARDAMFAVNAIDGSVIYLQTYGGGWF